MTKSKLEEIANQFSALGEPRRLSAFRDLLGSEKPKDNKTKSPEDAYSKNVFNMWAWPSSLFQNMYGSGKTSGSKCISPEDAYLKHVFNVEYCFSSAFPQVAKESMRNLSDLGSFYKTFDSAWLPIRDAVKVKNFCEAFPDFTMFYKPLVDAGLLDKNYAITEDAKKVYAAIKSLLQ